MAAMNSTLGAKMDNTYAAATILCCVAAAVCFASLWLSGQKIHFQATGLPFYYYFAGALVAFYILTITKSAKVIGLSNAIFLVIFGQIVAATVIDHIGAFNTQAEPISTSRIVGILVMLVGIYLSRIK